VGADGGWDNDEEDVAGRVSGVRGSGFRSTHTSSPTAIRWSSCGAKLDGETASQSIPGHAGDDADHPVFVTDPVMDRVTESHVWMERDSAASPDMPRSVALVFRVAALHHLEPTSRAMRRVRAPDALDA